MDIRGEEHHANWASGSSATRNSMQHAACHHALPLPVACTTGLLPCSLLILRNATAAAEAAVNVSRLVGSGGGGPRPQLQTRRRLPLCHRPQPSLAMMPLRYTDVPLQSPVHRSTSTCTPGAWRGGALSMNLASCGRHVSPVYVSRPGSIGVGHCRLRAREKSQDACMNWALVRDCGSIMQRIDRPNPLVPVQALPCVKTR